MFGNTSDIRSKTEEYNKDEACYGGFGGRLSYEASRANSSGERIARLLPRLAVGAAMCLFFGVLGTLCGVLMFNIVNDNQSLYYPDSAQLSQNAEDTAQPERATLDLSVYASNISVIRNSAAVENVTAEQSRRYRVPMGVMIHELAENGVFSDAGIQHGDIIVEFDGVSVVDSELLSEMLSENRGQAVPVTVFRDGTNIKLYISIG